MLTSLALESFDLGEQAPRITGVKGYRGIVPRTYIYTHTSGLEQIGFPIAIEASFLSAFANHFWARILRIGVAEFSRTKRTARRGVAHWLRFGRRLVCLLQ